jgi:RHS repeat-associated protein
LFNEQEFFMRTTKSKKAFRFLSRQRAVVAAVSVASWLAATSAWGTGWHWNAPDYGYRLDVSVTGGVAKQVGDRAVFRGSLQKVDSRDSFLGWLLGWFNSEDLRRDGVQLKLFYPTILSDVTSQAQINSRYEFTFTSPVLSGPGVLIAQVSNRSSRTESLQKAQAKLDLRVAALEEKIAFLSSRHAHKSEIDLLKRYRAVLAAISARVTDRINRESEILAEARIPLVVANQSGGDFYNSSVIGKFRFTVSYQGAPIEGTAVVAHTEIRNLSTSDSSNDKWIIEYNWNGAEVRESSPAKIAAGQVVVYDYPIAKLDPSKSNLFEIELFKAKSNGQKESKAYGELAFALPAVEDNTAPAFQLAVSTPDSAHPYVRDPQPVSVELRDSFGRIDRASVVATIDGQNITSTLQLEMLQNGAFALLSGALPALTEGPHTFRVTAKDLAGNAAAPYVVAFSVDRSGPVILGLVDHVLTRIPTFPMSVSVQDSSPVTTTVVLNGVQVFQSADPTFTTSPILQEGMNFVQVRSIDSAGNESTASLIDLALDTMAPILSGVLPQEGGVLSSLAVLTSGTANEPLAYAKANQSDLVLSADAKSFSGSLLFSTDGEQLVSLDVSDLAGNAVHRDIPIKIVLRLLNASLLSVAPAPDGAHALILGAAGAARPGDSTLQIQASAGFFNNGTAVPRPDGSFQIQLLPFTEATVTVREPSTGKVESATVYWRPTDTLLSGTVRDGEDHPIAGATVTLVGTGLSVQTDASGIFTISQSRASAITGIHRLAVDGTTAIQSDPPAPRRTFASTAIPVNVGLSQSNVLPRPIYLHSIPENAPTVDPAVGGMVTASNDSTVRLEIPADSVVFPSTVQDHRLHIARVNKDRATVAPLEYAMPTESVIALEPSGLKLQKRAKLVLPNDNELPPGVQVIILSMNSERGGIWEIDGLARVTADGARVETDDGFGLSHFSIIYASPVGPKVKAFGAQDKPGADTFNGALISSVRMPSFKSMGSDVSPRLNYRSTWARPGVVLSTVFNIPHEEVTVSVPSEKGGFLGLGRKEITDRYDAWYEPDFVTSEFATTGIRSEKARWDGPPSNAIISHSLDLGDPIKKEYLASGVYPYSAHYEVHLKQITVHTRTEKTFGLLNIGTPEVKTFPSDPVVEPLEQAFPQDVQGLLYTSDESHSPAGSGWKVSGAQRVVNPTENRIMLEESDGGFSGYSVLNTIETVYEANLGVDLAQSIDATHWPLVKVVKDLGGGTRQLAQIDLNQPAPAISDLQAFSDYSLRMCKYDWFPQNLSNPLGGLGTQLLFCRQLCREPQTLPREIRGLVSLGDGSVIGVDGLGLILKSGGTEFSILSGAQQAHPTINNRFGDADQNGALCASLVGHSCGEESVVRDFYTKATVSYNPLLPPPTPNHSLCAQDTPDLGQVIPIRGSSDGSLGSATWNRPAAVIPGRNPNTFVVADYGNNIVRLVDLGRNVVETIVGNRTNVDDGDEGSPLAAGIRTPNGLAYDSIGNLYISTGSGRIRVVNPERTSISTLVGGPDATPGDNRHAKLVQLSQPQGLVVDSVGGFLYIADPGDSTVRRLDLSTHKIVTVAGIPGERGYNGDGKAALFASLSNPHQVALDENRNLLIVDGGNGRIRRVTFGNTSGGTIAFAPASQDLSTLVREGKCPNCTWTRTYRNGLKVFFDADGYQTHARDRAGRETVYVQNSDGKGGKQLEKITYPGGKAASYTYTAGRLSSIADPAGRETLFSYNSLAQLERVSFPDGSWRGFEYDDHGLMQSEIKPIDATRTKKVQYHYNQWHRLEAVSDCCSLGTETVINDSASATVGNNYTDGQTGRMQSNSPGSELDNVLRNAKSQETVFEKDLNGFVSTIRDHKDRVTKVLRDLDGRVVKVTRPDQTVTASVYNTATGDLLEQSDSRSKVAIKMTYDGFGNLIRYENGTGASETYKYNPVTGLLDSKKDRLGRESSYTYDRGLIETDTSFLGRTTSYFYDEAGNLDHVETPGSLLTSFTYDDAGNILSTTNAEGQVTKYEYDLANRVTAVTTPLLERTEYSYSISGALVQIKDPLGKVQTDEYDQRGMLVKRTDFAGQVYVWTYDARGNLETEQDPKGRAAGYAKRLVYDDEDRVVRQELPDDVVAYQYDEQGRLDVVQNRTSKIQYEYDILGRVSDVTSSGLGDLSDLRSLHLRYKHDANSNRVEMSEVSENGTETSTSLYKYDAIDRLTSLENFKGERFSSEYNDEEQTAILHRPGSKTTMISDELTRKMSIVHSGGGTDISSFEYSADKVGNITQIKLNSGPDVRMLGYDKNNQLESATNPEVSGPLSAETFAYDKISNRTSDQTGAFKYDPTTGFRRLTEDYRFLYFYDENGNLSSKQQKGLGRGVFYTYSAGNQLTGLRVFENTGPVFDGASASLVKSVSYQYDAVGRRIQKSVVDHLSPLVPSRSYTRRYLYDQSAVLLEIDSSNQLLARYTHSPVQVDSVMAVDVSALGRDQSLAQQPGSYFYLKDGMGSVTEVVNSSGERLQHYVYSVYGQLMAIRDGANTDITESPVLATSYAFTGREYDSESGLYYYRARYYDPFIGRFLQKDPSPGRLQVPSSVINPYIYALNSPTRYSDSSGMSVWDDFFRFLICPVCEVVAVVAGAIGGNIGNWIHDALTSKTFQNIVFGVALSVICFATGGAAGPVFASWLSTSSAYVAGVGGAIAGGALGGTISGVYTVLTGQGDFWGGFWQGLVTGALSGFAGGFQAQSALNAASQATEAVGGGPSAANPANADPSLAFTKVNSLASDWDPIRRIIADPVGAIPAGSNVLCGGTSIDEVQGFGTEAGAKAIGSKGALRALAVVGKFLTYFCFLF